MPHSSNALIRLFQSLIPIMSLAVAASGCIRASRPSPLQPINEAPKSPLASLLVISKNPESLVIQAKQLGLTISGSSVLILSGPTARLKLLEVMSADEALAAYNEPVNMERPASAHADGRIAGFNDASEFGSEEDSGETHYLAQEEFGLPEHQILFPTHDGRGVKVGVIDDGISPFQSGFLTTSTGERKILAKTSQSSRFTLTLTSSVGLPPNASPFLQSVQESFSKAWVGSVNESSPSGSGDGDLDLNTDGTVGTLSVIAIQKADDSIRICLDRNTSGVVDSDECFGTFAATSEFGFWNAAKTFAATAEFDVNTATLQLTEGERPGDSHGEGVASVLAGHLIGGRFNGMAPGAQILDYDLGASVIHPEESLYTIATFVRALDWLGQQGAEVCNISYSLFFYSAASQQFMRQALDALVKRHGFVVSFSAGNNGPGLGSYNRGLIYPENALVAAAFVSKSLDERVHGVTGLPDEGRVIWYSSFGPSPDGGATPTAASPLASLTHSDPSAGFGAFSGTSSASPALAGFAAVLISAAKQEGLAIRPDLVVNAIRMSGRALTGAPYVQQGAGVPQIESALGWYRKLVRGEIFARIDASVDGPGPDGIKLTGILLRTSQTAGSSEKRVRLKGVVPSTVDAAHASEFLRAVKITYSHPWILGPERSFISIGGSSIAVNIAASHFTRGDTHFGDIRLFDDLTGDLLKVIPVTVIDDVPLTGPVSFTRTLGAEEGTTVHFFVPAGTAGIKANLKLISGNPLFARVRVYDSSAKAVASYSGSQFDNVWIPTPTAGWYQLGFAKSGGTAEPIIIEGVAEPIAIRLGSTGLQSSQGTLKLFNSGTLPIDARIVVRAAPVETHSAIVQEKGMDHARAEWPIDHAGSYSFSSQFLDFAEVSYPYPACYVRWVNADGSLKRAIGVEEAIEVETAELGGKFELLCRPFEFTSNSVGALIPYNWRLTMNRRDTTTPTTAIGDVVTRIPVGLSVQTIRWISGTLPADGTPPAGTNLNIEITQPTVSERGAVDLGLLQTF